VVAVGGLLLIFCTVVICIIVIIAYKFFRIEEQIRRKPPKQRTEETVIPMHVTASTAMTLNEYIDFIFSFHVTRLHYFLNLYFRPYVYYVCQLLLKNFMMTMMNRHNTDDEDEVTIDTNACDDFQPHSLVAGAVHGVGTEDISHDSHLLGTSQC